MSPNVRLSILLQLVPALAFAQAERPPVPTHPDPVVQGVQAHIDSVCESHDARLAAIADQEQLEPELARARARFLELLDLDLDRPRAAPKATPAGTLDFPGYRIEKVVIESAPGVPVTCNLYVPKGGAPRKPALICPHGHSGRDRPVYQNGYQRLAKAGFIVLAKDGWGKQERRATGHGESGGQLALTGTSLMALELLDNIRCIDYLLGRPDVDGQRLGMLGLSGGGSQTLYTAAVERRLRAASPTCAVTTFRADLADTTMCVCELSQDILSVGDHGLFLAMAYPHPLLVVNGTDDGIFPISGARVAAEQARRLYEAGGHAEGVQFAEFDSPHTWSDAMIDLQIRWFRRQFDLPDLEVLPPGDGPRDPNLLRCFEDSDLPPGSQTLSGLNRERMSRRSSEAQARSLTEDRRRLQDQLRRLWSGEPTAPDEVEDRDLGHDPSFNLDRRRLSWRSGLGGMVSAEVTRPAAFRDEDGNRLVVHLGGSRSEPRLEQLYWDDRFRQSATVVDLTITGETLSPTQEGQVSSALLTSGRSLLAERVRDVLVALEVVRGRGLMGPGGDLILVGHGFHGALLLFASPLLPADTQLVLDQTPISYQIGAETDFATPRLLAPPFHWTILPTFATHLDLPGLLELAHPRRVLLAHPLDSAQQALGRDELATALGHLSRIDRDHIEAITKEQTRADVFHRLNQIVDGRGQ